MKLDRNLSADGKGKYSLINNRTNQVQHGLTPEDEFFVIKLKDAGACCALSNYATIYDSIDPEFACEVRKLAKRSGPYHPLCKNAD